MSHIGECLQVFGSTSAFVKKVKPFVAPEEAAF